MTALPRRAQNRLDRERRILDAALTVFGAMGYSGATMDAVAAEAGLTKPTLYSYFPSKESLFSAMMLDRRDAMLEVFEHPSPGGMVADLHTFAWDYADTVMRPDLLRAYQASGPDHVLRGIMRYLDHQRAEGRLTFDDAELAAQDLWGLILSAPRTQALYMPDAPPDRATLARYIHNGLRVFLRAYSTDPQADLAQLAALTAPPTGET